MAREMYDHMKHLKKKNEAMGYYHGYSGFLDRHSSVDNIDTNIDETENDETEN